MAAHLYRLVLDGPVQLTLNMPDIFKKEKLYHSENSLFILQYLRQIGFANLQFIIKYSE